MPDSSSRWSPLRRRCFVDSSSSLELAGFLLTAFIAAVAFTAAKQAGGSNARALIYTALVLVFACIILVIKHAVH